MTELITRATPRSLNLSADAVTLIAILLLIILAVALPYAWVKPVAAPASQSSLCPSGSACFNN